MHKYFSAILLLPIVIGWARIILRQGVVSVIGKCCDHHPVAHGGFSRARSGHNCAKIVTVLRLFASSY
ncbi:hypothetical protein TH8_14260 [Thalassospira profundimaris]|nr:hypothetical protein TH8_14260 [Thalassospira profundimaris]